MAESTVCSSLLLESLYSQASQYVRPDYTAMTQKQRGHITEWLAHVCASFNLSKQTLYLAIDYIERYVHAEPCNMSLTVLAAFWVAVKFEHGHCFPLSFMTDLTPKPCSPGDLLHQELKLLHFLDYRLNTPTIITFLGVYIEISNRRSGAPMFTDHAQIQMYCLADIISLDIKSTQFSYHEIAASIIYLHLEDSYKFYITDLCWVDITSCVEYTLPFFDYIISEAGQGTLPPFDALVDSISIQVFQPDFSQVQETGLIVL